MKPLVSILIPAYNSQGYIREALDSALSQTYKNIEIIVHDDASTDDTPKILKQYKDKRLRVITTKMNHGMVGGWNYILTRAKGKYIKFLASDDMLSPDCVSKMVSVAESVSNLALVTCKRELIDDIGSAKGFLKFSSRNIVVDGIEHARWTLTTLTENKIGEPTSVLLPRKLIKHAGYFDKNLHNLVDLECWLRLLQFGDLAYINEPLCSFRIHSATSTSRAIREGLFIDDFFYIIKKYSDTSVLTTYQLTRNDLDLVKNQKTRDVLKNIKDLVLNGDTDRAKIYMNRLRRHVSLNNILSALVAIPFSRVDQGPKITKFSDL